MERVGQSLFAIDWHSFPGWSKGKLQNPPDKSLFLVRFVCAKPLNFVKLGLSSLATEHLTLRRSGGEGEGDWGGHSLSLQELWRETLETKLPLQQLVPSFFCHRWQAKKVGCQGNNNTPFYISSFLLTAKQDTRLGYILVKLVMADYLMIKAIRIFSAVFLLYST